MLDNDRGELALLVSLMMRRYLENMCDSKICNFALYLLSSTVYAVNNKILYFWYKY